MRGIEIGEFKPRRLMSNGHVQTIAGNFLRRVDWLPEPETERVEVEPAKDERAACNLFCLSHWQSQPELRPTAIVLHGLEGSARSQYVRGNASKLWAAGWNVVRMNMRNCGGGAFWGSARHEVVVEPGVGVVDPDAVCPTLYHSGLSGDVRAVATHFVRTRGLRKVALIGYSMGGNMVLKLAGELHDEPMAEIVAAVAVSPAANLGPSAERLHRPVNRAYELRFLRALKKHFLHKAALYPQRFSAERHRNIHSIGDFDEKITAHYMGFAGADDYYARASASRLADKVAVPTLLIHAMDDPFVTLLPESRERYRANPNVTLVEPEHGGHCAFLADADPEAGDDGYWAEQMALGFLQRAIE